MTRTETIPNDSCVRYEHCGNVVEDNGRMCPECLDMARKAQRNDEELEWNI